MKKLCLSILLLLTAAILAPARDPGPRTDVVIDSGWKFRQVGTENWSPATVPGCVHTDLLDNGRIEDPFYRDNEKGLQWIGKTDWEYTTTFDLSAAASKRENIELLFEGLDTYAAVFLNDSKILEADNMFRTWRVDVKPYVREGANTLRIHFRSPINEVLPRMKKLDYQIPAPNDQGEITSPYTRKAPYHFGWDWGPRFVTSGIWRPVHLVSWDKTRIEDLRIRQNRLTEELADLTADIEIVGSMTGSATIEVENQTDGRVVASKQVEIVKGLNRVSLDFYIKDPELWYPVGLGGQPLYKFEARVKTDGTTIDTATRRTGLRTLELRQQTDEWGKSFEFVVNGIPVFGKGGNWIPADSFQTRVTKEKYRMLLTSFKDANMNMIRVWGGGIYEEDYFYDLADEMGILVWQDFMFGVSMYPGDPDFLENVRQEAIDNVKRLRNHPSIILWCGNNESETAWQHWGWKERLPDVLWENYKKIFLRILPSVVEEYDPSRPYWSSSPSSDLEDDADSQKSGDVHYWAVWHAEKPFSEYQKQYPRFMSEYGFQSFPGIETVKSYTTADDRKSIETPVMLAHQRHPRGNQLIREYMLREFEEPKDFESFLYVSQVLQAEGIKLGTEHLRRIMPRNMGALYWQLNDCWPVASWSGTDYFGRWKAMHYYARRFFEPLMVSAVEENGNLSFYVVSDYPEENEATLTVRAMNLAGDLHFEKTVGIKVEPLKGKAYYKFPVEELKKGNSANNVVVIAELSRAGKTVSTAEYFFAPFKELEMSMPNIDTEVAEAGNDFRIKVSSDKVAKAVLLVASGMDGHFTDNYFTLVPGTAKEVEFVSKKKITAGEFKQSLRVRSLVDAFGSKK